MSTPEPISRWAEGTSDDSPEERQLAQLFAAVPEPAPLDELARQRVAVRLRTGASRGVGLMLLRLGAAGVVVGVSGAAAAQWAAEHWFAAPQSPVNEQTAVVVPAPSLVSRPSPSRLEAERRPEPAIVEPAPDVLPSSAPARVPSAAPSSSRLGQEASSLTAALSALKAGGKDNAARALSAIDRHLQTFAHGSLELEARVARVDALLVLGRRQEARRELAGLPIENVGRKHELRLIRAELRADDDCRGALADFQVLTAQSLPSAWAERALFGQGACQLKLGNDAAAERDFARYLERFPNGRFAEQIRAQTRR